MTWQTCTAPGSCTSKTGKVVINSNWRWLHDKTSGSYTNCYTGNTWNTTLCEYTGPVYYLLYLSRGLLQFTEVSGVNSQTWFAPAILYRKMLIPEFEI